MARNTTLPMFFLSGVIYFQFTAKQDTILRIISDICIQKFSNWSLKATKGSELLFGDI
jgi:hypothetical protein